MKFQKYALGNDYLIYDPEEMKIFHREQIIRICHAISGWVMILLVLCGLKKQNWAKNSKSDGSEAEKAEMDCGFLLVLRDSGKVGSKSVWILRRCCFRKCEVITVEMGQAIFTVKSSSQCRVRKEVLNEILVVRRQFAATIGNPHCVIPVDQANEEIVMRLGPILENHPNFPNRTNVQFLQILDRNRIRIEIWERGAGYTLASGSSSSAAGAVARKMGACDQKITVEMPGGEIKLEIDEEFKVKMTGPATRVASMELDSECLK